MKCRIHSRRLAAGQCLVRATLQPRLYPVPLSSTRSWGFDGGCKLMVVCGMPSGVRSTVDGLLGVGLLTMFCQGHQRGDNGSVRQAASVEYHEPRPVACLRGLHTRKAFDTDLPSLQPIIGSFLNCRSSISKPKPCGRGWRIPYIWAQALGALSQASKQEGRLVAQEPSQQTGLCEQLGSQRHHAMHQKSTYRSHPTTNDDDPNNPPTCSPGKSLPNFSQSGKPISNLSRREREPPAQTNNGGGRGGVRKGQASNDESGMKMHLTPTHPLTAPRRSSVRSTSEANRRE
jgi:hypothetical protein